MREPRPVSVSSPARCTSFVSSSPVRICQRWDLDSASALGCVCLRIGMRSK